MDPRHTPISTTGQICEWVGGNLDGPAGLNITGIEQIERAQPGQLTFIGTRQYAAKWSSSRASAALAQQDLSLDPGTGRALIRVPDPDLALAIVLEKFAPMPPGHQGVHRQAAVDPQAQIEPGVAIGAFSFVGPRARVGQATVIHPNVTILDDVVIGAGCALWPGVVIRERCIIGDRCILHPNVAIGGDGFGYRPAPGGRSLIKIPHIGIVTLGRDVEIGAGTCIDRGKFSETLIGDGTKIDNLCQIGHNCRIGRCVVIAGQVGIGGSVTIGDGVMIGGGAIIKDHITIGDGAKVGGASAVMHDVPAGESWHGHPAQDARATFREFAAIRKLPDLLRTIRRQVRLDNSTSKRDDV